MYTTTFMIYELGFSRNAMTTSNLWIKWTVLNEVLFLYHGLWPVKVGPVSEEKDINSFKIDILKVGADGQMKKGQRNPVIETVVSWEIHIFCHFATEHWIWWKQSTVYWRIYY